MEARAEMTAELSSLAMCIKDRTIRNNYASTYAVESFSKQKTIGLNYLSSSNIHLIKVLKKLYEIFSGVWHDLGYSWEDLKDWMTARHIPAMQIIHVEVKFYH